MKLITRHLIVLWMQTAYSKVQNHVFLAKLAMFRNYFTQVSDGEFGTWALLNSVKKIHWNTKLGVSHVFHLSTQSIKPF